MAAAPPQCGAPTPRVFFEAWRSPAQDYTNLLNCEVPRRTAAIYSNTRKNFRHKVSMTLFKENQRLRPKLL